MKARLIHLVILLLILLLLAAGSVQAMGSTHYRVDWYHPMTGAGMISNSAQFAAELTVGQTSILQAQSANAKAALGFWGPIQSVTLYIPYLKK